MSEWVYAGLAVLIAVIVVLERSEYRKYIEQQAKDRGVVFINGKSYRIIPEEQAVNWELRDLYDKYGGHRL